MNTKKLAIFASAIITAICGQADTCVVDGYTWEYDVSGGIARVRDVTPRTGDVTIPLYLDAQGDAQRPVGRFRRPKRA